MLCVAVVLASSCSSGSNDDDSPEPTTSAAAVENVTGTITQPEMGTTTTETAEIVSKTQGLRLAPGTETTTTSSATATTTSSATSAQASTTTTSSLPSEAPNTTSTTTTISVAPPSTTTTTTSAEPPTTTTSTTISVPSVDDLRVKVLNGSGISGAAGRLTARLEESGWDVLPAGNAPRRYAASVVYYSHDVLEDQAAEIAVATGVGEVVSLAMPSPAPFVVEGADVYVVVLIGADDLGGSLRPPERTSGLRPRQRNDVRLPLPDSMPRDIYVPGLANINIYSQINDQGSLDLQAKLDELAIFMRYVGNYQPYVGATAENRDTNGTFREVAKLIEDTLLWMGFTPQNVCGAPAGYSFTDLLQPTREWSEELKVYSGDAIFTTDRLIALHGGERINPEANLEFYIQQAVQTAHDALRLPELLDETEAPQLILCRAFLAPSGEVPEFANGAWYALLTPGIQPRESLLSQGTYHVKEISRNGNLVHIIVCHPTIRERHILLHWRETGYRAEILGYSTHTGCQGTFDGETSISEDSNGAEDAFRFGFGERVFSAGDLQGFPRS